jgi:radical SAM superfamily enzyme
VVVEQEFKLLLLLLIITQVELEDQVVVEQPHQVLVELVTHLLQLLLKETMVVLVFTLELILRLKVEAVELVPLEEMEVLEALVELAELE